ncbi:hypothetical protein, partial [Gemmatimonas sp.]|uniref:hypothetical protein n=1 Tax=Gemmatimonas sp. TaxID=1962908 RepID=UPI00334069B1
ATARATRAEQRVAAMAGVVEAAEEWEFAKVQATAARMVAGATGRPVQAPDRSETLANMRLVSAVRAYRAAQPGDGGGE